MRESKLKSIAYELKNLWTYLTRQELCAYYDVSERTLCNYKNKLGLPKNISTETKIDKPVKIYIKEGNSYNPQSFKSWEHFAIWEKAQSHSIKIDTVEKGGKSFVTCEFLNKRPEAIKYENSLNI